MPTLIRIRTTLKVKEEAGAWAAGLQSICRFPVGNTGQNIQLISVPPALFASPGISRAVRSAFRGPWKKDSEFTVEYQYENHLAYISPDPEKVEAVQLFLSGRAGPSHYVYSVHTQSVPGSGGDETNPLLKAKKFMNILLPTYAIPMCANTALLRIYLNMQA